MFKCFNQNTKELKDSIEDLKRDVEYLKCKIRELELNTTIYESFDGLYKPLWGPRKVPLNQVVNEVIGKLKLKVTVMPKQDCYVKLVDKDSQDAILLSREGGEELAR